MKTLSLLQPWASLVALGEKRIETRSWPTKHEGPLLIHASARMGHFERELMWSPIFHHALFRHSEIPLGDGFAQIKARLDEFDQWMKSQCGKILCQVSLLYCVPTETVRGRLTEKELAFGDYSDGRWAWIFNAEVRRFANPVPARGSRGLWEFDLKAREARGA